MAYKFQLGSAVLSGSTKFEELVEAAGGFKPTVADTAAAVADDSFYFQDSDGAMKRESMADYATAIAGDGLAASSGVLAVGVDDSTLELNSDALRIKNSGVTAAKLNTDVISAQVELAHADIADADELMISDGGVLKKVGLDSLRDHYFGQVSGDATVADGGALTIGTGVVEHAMLAADCIDGDNIQDDVVNSEHLAAGAIDTEHLGDNQVTLAKMAGITRGSLILGDSSGDPSLLAKGTAAQFLQSDGTDPSYVSISGDATVAAGGALTIAAEAVHSSMMNDDAISGHTELAHADILDADEMLISDGGILKKVGVDSLRDHFFGVVSGDATIADGGALTIGANAIQTGMVHDDVATELAGVGLGASGGVLAVQVSGAIKATSDKLGISGSFAGIGLSYDGGVDSIEGIDLDLNELTGGAIANGDFLAFVDADDSNVTKKEAVADLATLFAGSGLGASSAVMAVNVDDTGIEVNGSDALQLKDNGVTLAKMAGLAAAKFILGDSNGDPAAVTISGDATLSNAGELTIAANAVEDSMVNDNVATGLAGVGLSAASGVLAHPNSAITNKDFSSAVTLSVGYNVPDGTSMGGAVVANMPAPEVGAKVTVKAPGDCSQTNTVTIQGATMDGVTSLVLEGPGASVTLICNNAGSDSWVIV